MATQIKASRAKPRVPVRIKLTSYESDQVAQISTWKSRKRRGRSLNLRGRLLIQCEALRENHTRGVRPDTDRAVFSTGCEAGQERRRETTSERSRPARAAVKTA